MTRPQAPSPLPSHVGMHKKNASCAEDGTRGWRLMLSFSRSPSHRLCVFITVLLHVGVSLGVWVGGLAGGHGQAVRDVGCKSAPICGFTCWGGRSLNNFKETPCSCSQISKGGQLPVGIGSCLARGWKGGGLWSYPKFCKDMVFAWHRAGAAFLIYRSLIKLRVSQAGNSLGDLGVLACLGRYCVHGGSTAGPRFFPNHNSH